MKIRQFQPDNNVQITCLGIPFRDERPLNEDERRMLQFQFNQSLWHGFGFGCLAPLLSLSLLALSALVASNFGIAIFLVTSVIALGMLILIGRDKLHLAWKNWRNLRDGHIRRYHGFYLWAELLDDLPDGDHQKVGTIGSIDVDFSQPITLEVFSTTRHLYTVNGIKVVSTVILQEEYTAQTPGSAEITMEWEPPSRATGNGLFGIENRGQRELSESEKREIRHYIHWKRYLPIIAWTLFTAAIFIQYGLHFWDSITPHTKFVSGTALLMVPIFFLIVTVYGIYYSLSAVRKIWQFLTDIKEGIVIITYIPEHEEDGEIIPEMLVEWIPHSHLEWSINGKPAYWRISE